ncbi:NADP-dependent oxidoreductase [Limibacter armeniacum]|uniref:NADP-dependent oxidoreductase n=1 Tax=Limibacter armeniacum TaxID=466084 RepID=UPI002FE510D5
MMKAFVLEKAGPAENLKIKEIDKPPLKEGEILVAVKAISINPADVKIRAAEEGIKSMYAGAENIILGWDIAGTVEEVGSGVTHFKKGDKVFGMVNFPGQGNAYAEYVAAPENQMAKIPDNVSFEEAAATTLAALTALQVLENRVKKGDRVLIQAGSGGVGHFAIQIAKYYGAYVITTASGNNREFVMSLGADEHIDYQKQNFVDILSDIDFVLDGIGGKVLEDSIKVLKEGGTIISLPTSKKVLEEMEAKTEKKIHTIPLLVHSDRAGMVTLSQFLADGTLEPTIFKTFPFDEMQEAHKEVEAGRTVGKIIVTL